MIFLLAFGCFCAVNQIMNVVTMLLAICENVV